MNHEEGIKGGMNDYIAKPIKREIVCAVNQKWILYPNVGAPAKPAESSE